LPFFNRIHDNQIEEVCQSLVELVCEIGVRTRTAI
jgi:hypothetical protein